MTTPNPDGGLHIPYMDEYANLRTFKLDKIRIHLQMILSNELLGSDVEMVENYIIDSVIFKLKGYLFGEIQDPIEISYPVDWWQAFKQKYAPHWFIKRWPVKMVHHTVDLRVIYNQFKPQMPDQPWIIRANDYKRVDPHE